MAFVVTPNRRKDRGTKKWLLRLTTESPEEAMAYHVIVAKGIRFGSAWLENIGFGCGVAVLCEEAVGYNKCRSTQLPLPSEELRDELHFIPDKSRFFLVRNTRNMHEVKRTPSAHFCRNGKILFDLQGALV